MSTPNKGDVFKHRYNGRLYSFVALFEHPEKQPYHRSPETMDQIIVQIYGNFSNEMECIPLPAFHHLFDFSFGALKLCRFCGFRRDMPCTERQACPNLIDYRLEPDDTEDTASELTRAA